MLLLTWAMMRSRRIQALTLLAITAVAVAAAVAAGVYVGAAQQRILADDVAAASPDERVVTVSDPVRRLANPDSQVEQAQLVTSRQRAFDTKAPSQAKASGLDTVFFARYPAFVADRPWIEHEKINAWMEFREGFCDHIILVEGRCVSGPGEVVVTPAKAAAGFGVSKPLTTTPLEQVFDDQLPASLRPGPVAFQRGRPSTVVVVGVYEPRDSADPYWGLPGRDSFSPEADGVLTDRQTLASMLNEKETQGVLAYPQPGTFTLGHLDDIRSAANNVVLATSDYRSSAGIVALLDRIDRDNRTVALVAGVATVPLVALCWYVLYIAIAHATRARRRELGMVKLRGVSSRDQWWIAAMENLGPVVVGALIGYPLGHLGVWLYARVAFGDQVRVGLSATSLPYAALALAGALVAGLVAIRSDLAATATQLLREVPSPRRGWRGAAAAWLVCALAVLSLVQLRTAAGTDLLAGQDGVGRFAPALLIIGLGLVIAVLVDPLCGWIGRRALRRGRLGLALAGIYIGRRHGGARLVSLVLVAVALGTFAAAASGFAAAERSSQISLKVGANQVLSVRVTTPQDLLNRVRSVDPEGTFAMAVAPIVSGEPSATLLAIDAPRLPAVASWPQANVGMDVSAAAKAMRAPTADPIEIHGSGLAVFAKLTNPTTQRFPVNLGATIAQLDTGAMRSYELVAPVTPDGPYTTNVACSAGCRLIDVSLSAPPTVVTFEDRAKPEPEVTISSLRQTSPDRELASGPELARWRAPALGPVQTEPSDTGLRARLTLVPPQPAPILPPDAPTELAVIDAGQSNLFTLPFSGGRQVITTVAGRPDQLPRLGRKGVFVDLESVLRLGEPRPAGSAAEVWLGPAAPPDAEQRLVAAGLVMLSRQSYTDELAIAGQRPAAVGLRFLLIVAMFGVALSAAGLVVAAGVERRGRSAELRALRIQGLSEASVRRTALLGYVAIAAVASVLGLGAGLAVWQATGAYLPILDTTMAAPPPLLPGWSVLVVAGAEAVVLVAFAAFLALRLVRSARLSSPR